MKSNISSFSMPPGIGWFNFWLPLLALLSCGSAWGAPQDIDIVSCPTVPALSYAVKPNTSVTPAVVIKVLGASGDVAWDLAPGGASCSGSGSSYTCL